MLLLAHVLELVLQEIHLAGQLLDEDHVLALDDLAPLVHLLRVLLVGFYHGLGMSEPAENVTALAHRPESEEGSHLQTKMGDDSRLRATQWTHIRMQALHQFVTESFERDLD